MNKYILRCIRCVGSRAVIIYIVATHFTYNYFLDSEKPVFWFLNRFTPLFI